MKTKSVINNDDGVADKEDEEIPATTNSTVNCYDDEFEFLEQELAEEGIPFNCTRPPSELSQLDHELTEKVASESTTAAPPNALLHLDQQVASQFRPDVEINYDDGATDAIECLDRDIVQKSRCSVSTKAALDGGTKVIPDAALMRLEGQIAAKSDRMVADHHDETKHIINADFMELHNSPIPTSNPPQDSIKGAVDREFAELDRSTARQPSRPGAYAQSFPAPNSSRQQQHTSRQTPQRGLSSMEESLPLEMVPHDEPSEDSLQVANPVVDERHSRLDIPTAEPQDNNNNKGQKTFEKLPLSFKYIGLFSVGFTILLIVFVGLVVAAVAQQQQQGEGTSRDVAPTNTTEAGRPTTPQLLESLLPIATLSEIHRTNNTPQAMAYHWILQDPVLLQLQNNGSGDAHASRRIKQRFALATLYYATTGDRWDKNMHWLDHNLHECYWFAAEGHKKENNQLDGYVPIRPEYYNPCELPPSSFSMPLTTNDTLKDIPITENQYYVHLWLRSNGLNGFIPPELFWGLTSLQSLSLRFNELTGTIPTEIGLLTDLEAITLGGTEALTGTVPTEVGALTNLISLVLWGNRLSGTFPSELGKLTQLHELLVDTNYFTGSLPKELGQLSAVHWLYLHDNYFNGTFPEFTWELPMLEELTLRGNNFTGTLPTEIGLMDQMALMFLEENGFSGTVPTEIGLLSDNLFWLFLDWNALTGTIPTQLGNCRGLGSIALFSNELTGTIPTELGLLSLGYGVDLSQNALNGSIPTELGLLPSSWSVIPTDIGLLGDMALHLENNNLSGQIPSEIGQRVDLSILSLQSNNLSGAVPSQLGLLVNLTTFNISDNPLLTGEVPSSLCDFQPDGFECSDTLGGCSCPGSFVSNISSGP